MRGEDRCRSRDSTFELFILPCIGTLYSVIIRIYSVLHQTHGLYALQLNHSIDQDRERYVHNPAQLVLTAPPIQQWHFNSVSLILGAIQSDSNNIKHSRTSLVISPRIKKKEKKIKQRNIFLINCPQPAHARHLRHGQTTSKSPFFQHPHIQDHPAAQQQQQQRICTVIITSTTCSFTISIESSFQIQHEHDNHGRHTAPGGAGPVLRATSNQ